MTTIKDTPRYEVRLLSKAKYCTLDICGYDLTYYGTIAMMCPFNKHEATRLRDALDEWLNKQGEEHAQTNQTHKRQRQCPRNRA